jgi:cell division protein FtsA
MARSGLFTGVDIGTSSIKVLVAEYIRGDMNIIGVGNAKSEGLKNGIIVDIDKVAASLKKAVEAAEERAGVEISSVNVGLPATMLEVESCQGMVPIANGAQEITNNDVRDVVDNALLRTVLPEREVITVVPTDFTVDGFEEITDPRGMFGTRLEMRGLLYTGPKTILHNLKKTVEVAGLKVENVIINPLSASEYVLNEGEREFGSIIIDLGAGQTSTVAVKEQRLTYVEVSTEGGDYVTKDISTVLNTSIESAEDIKVNYGEASTDRASKDERFLVDTVGHDEPVAVDEYYLAQIIEARMTQIFSKIRQDLQKNHVSDYPGGVILIGGGAAMPGVTELASNILGTSVSLCVPAEMGLRNPVFANVIGIINYVGNLTDIQLQVQNYARTDKSNNIYGASQGPSASTYDRGFEEYDYMEKPKETKTPKEPRYDEPVKEEPAKENGGLTNRMRDLFGNMFD